MQTLIRKILSARIYEAAKRTPLESMPQLSEKLQHQIWLKREDMQPVFSFKLRGAYNKISQLDEAVLARGVVCASAGNHAQGVAFSGKKLKIHTTIVMPTNASLLKVNACRNHGAEVILHGENFDEAGAYAKDYAAKAGKAFIHPFDDIDVIAGQGTIGKEIFEQNSCINAVFIPIGGGGLAAGVATYIKFIAPHCRIIGVEPEESASMFAALEKQALVELPQVGIFADGVAVKKVGENTFEFCRQYLDEIILVSTDEICAAMKDIFEDTRAISEPSGALSIAGIKKYAQQHPELKNQHFAGILSGANINFDRLRYVAERTELGEKKEAILAVTIPEEVGSFRRFIEFLGKRGITEFNYRYADDRIATVFVGINLTQGEKEKQQIMQELIHKSYQVQDLSENEIAKNHIRYMVGGKATHLNNESLFHFIFPEQPGALSKFLRTMPTHWNISLFHYRNHGADYGRVLIGIQIPLEEKTAFHTFIASLGYEYTEETDNLAYRYFL